MERTGITKVRPSSSTSTSWKNSSSAPHSEVCSVPTSSIAWAIARKCTRNLVDTSSHAGSSRASSIAIRSIRRDANEQLKRLLKDKAVAEDDERRAQDDVQRLTDRVIAEIDRQLGLVEAATETDTERDDDGWADERPAGQPAAPAEAAAGSALAIAGYDGLGVAQIRPLLRGLSHGELRLVLERAHERTQ